MPRSGDRANGREAQRLETRKRVFDAAVAEIGRTGLADADVGAIAAAAGVARGTFYFHFPTKEHVVAEVARMEQARMAADFGRFVETQPDLAAALAEIVRLVVAMERRLGRALFREVLALHFSPASPPDDGWRGQAVIALVVTEIERARDNGAVYADVDPRHSALYFLMTLYALLVTSSDAKAARTAAVETAVRMVLRGLEAR